MKQFAFPIGVKCANPDEYKQCLDIIKSIGDRRIADEPFSGAYNYLHVCLTFTRTGVYNSWGGREENMYYIDHFNPDLIRDIAASCTNDTWQEDEMALVYTCIDDTFKYEKVCGLLNHKICENKSKRPTIAEICAHHGYEIKGRDIVKKETKQTNMNEESTFPRVMLVSNSRTQWVKRVVFMKKANYFIAWSSAETVEEAEKEISVVGWKYAKEVDNAPVELTIDQIADKFGIEASRIKIKK